jgi:hypothetical protein
MNLPIFAYYCQNRCRKSITSVEKPTFPKVGCRDSDMFGSGKPQRIDRVMLTPRSLRLATFPMRAF